MEDPGRLLLPVVSLILLFLQTQGGILDLNELKSVNYGIDILSKPVSMGETAPPGAIFLASMYGQQYQCAYPDVIEETQKEAEVEKEAEATGIPELLRPMEDGPCIIYTKDWWTYEFCYGKYIKQYHMEDGKQTGEIMYLGHYESEFDWNNATSRPKKSSHLSRYHSHQYVNGSLCELTGKQRRTEVRFHCEEGHGDYISRIDEPETCVYILGVKTTKICHHPYLKSTKPAKPVPITCNPLLTVQQYQDYMLQLEEEEKARNEEAARVKEQEEAEAEKLRLSELEDEDEGLSDEATVETEGEEEESVTKDKTVTDDDVVNSAVDALQKLFSDSLTKGLQDILDEEGFGDGPQGPDVKMDMKVKILKDPKELRQHMNELLSKEKKKKKGDGEERDEEEEEDVDSDSTKERKLRLNKGAEDAVDTEEDVTDEEENMSDAESRRELDKEIMKEFEDGLEDIPGADSGRLSKYKQNIESAMTAQFEGILEEAQQELEQEGFEGDMDKTLVYSNLAKTLNKLLKKLENAEKEIKSVDEEIKKREKLKTELEAELGDKKDSSSKDLSEDVKDEDDFYSRKVEVKIITAGYYDANDNTVHMLDGEDGAAFNKMIITILGGSNEAAREEQRQEKLESNYGFVYGKDDKTSSKHRKTLS